MKYEILEILKEANTCVSGGEISKKLGISRNAVWKNINNLKKDGYDITSFANKGYMLISSCDKVNPMVLQKSVPGKVYYFDTCISTNIEAKKAEGVPDMSVFVAENQTGGRGRLGRSWVSVSGSGLYMSIYLEPNILPEKVSQLTVLAGIAVSRAITASKIKWPNDVLLSGKKVSGILTEMVAELDCTNKVIIGIGVNINNETFPLDLVDKATSMYLKYGKKYDKNEIASKILTEFFEIYDEFKTKGFSLFREEYIKNCATLNREVVIEKGGEKIPCTALDITDNAELVVEIDGERKIVSSGEVSVRGLLGYN